VVVALYQLGVAQAAAGDLAGALKSDQEALQTARKIAAANPTSTTQQQRDVTVALTRLGAVEIAGGDLADALKDGRESLDIARKLAALDPNSAEAKRDLAVSLTLMAKLAGSGVSWADVAAQYGALKAAGVLAVGDEPRLAEAQSHAAPGTPGSK
jgi:tetratricopeptide (TPR) repeat protein